MPEKKEIQTKTATIQSAVVSSPDGAHRYLLTRCWDKTLPKLLVVMIRPGYSGLVVTDTTTGLCIQQAVTLGFGSVAVANIYSRLGMGDADLSVDGATDAENDLQLAKAAGEADTVVLATGRKNSRVIEERRTEVLELLRPHAAKLREIADKDGRTGFHPLSPRIRFHWTLVPLVLDSPDKTGGKAARGAEDDPKTKP